MAGERAGGFVLQAEHLTGHFEYCSWLLAICQ